MLADSSRIPAALTHGAALTQNPTLFTVIETPIFTRLWPDYWDEDERGEFVAWLAENAEAGAVIRRSGGCRKVRWKRAGKGKRGGVRVIHYNRLADGTIYLLLIYSKGVRDDIDATTLYRIRRTLDGEDD
jgi:hypothetical protein